MSSEVKMPKCMRASTKSSLRRVSRFVATIERYYSTYWTGLGFGEDSANAVLYDGGIQQACSYLRYRTQVRTPSPLSST